MQKLKETRGVELIDRFLPSTEYDDLIAGCDLILLPYDADQYRSRLSAIFVDATCAGVPVVVPEGTWMSRQLEEGLGAGGAFAALSPEAIAAVVRAVASDVGRGETATPTRLQHARSHSTTRARSCVRCSSREAQAGLKARRYVA